MGLEEGVFSDMPPLLSNVALQRSGTPPNKPAPLHPSRRKRGEMPRIMCRHEFEETRTCGISCNLDACAEYTVGGFRAHAFISDILKAALVVLLLLFERVEGKKSRDQTRIAYRFQEVNKL